MMLDLIYLSSIIFLAIGVWGFVKFLNLCDDVAALRKKLVVYTAQPLSRPIQTKESIKNDLTTKTENRLLEVIHKAESSMFNRSLDDTLQTIGRIIDEYNARLEEESLGVAPDHLSCVDKYLSYYKETYG